MTIKEALERLRIHELDQVWNEPRLYFAIRRRAWDTLSPTAAVHVNGGTFTFRRFPQDYGYRWIAKATDLMAEDWYVVDAAA